MNKNSSGIGVFGLLGIAFVVLKLMNVIDWSWWYVTLPFWGGFALVAGVVVIAFVVGTIPGIFDYTRRRIKLRLKRKNK